MEPSSAGQGKWRRQSERRTPNCRSDNPAQRCPSRDDGRDEFALDSCVDRSTAISTRVRLFRLFLLIPCWESQRLIPKRSAGPRATKIGVVSLKALDHHRPNREVRLFRLFLLIPCWESQRLIPKRSAGPRATKIGVVSLKALDHHRPNREESAN